jgi:hypothetical protein
MATTTAPSAGSPAAISHPARQPLPLIWPGYLIAFVLLVIDFGEALFDPSLADDVTSPLWILGNVVYIFYWAFCIYRIHAVLRDITGGLYPISPGKAAGFHFIPFYNLFWIFHWTNTLADFLNANSAVRMRRVWPGIWLLVGFATNRFVGELAVVIVFSVLLYVVRKVGKALP